MAAPSETRTETLKILRAARKDLSSAPWLLHLKRQPPEVRTEAAIKVLDTEQAILALGNAELASIRDKLIENEKDLREGKEALEEARKKLNRVKTMLSKLGAVLGTVGKVVKFVTTTR